MALSDDGNLIAVYRSRVEKFKEVDTQKELTIKELLDHLERVQCECQQTTLDFETERDERRRLQQQVQKLRADLDILSNRRSFVVMLIDADADDYVFQSKFLNNGAEGGKQAADKLTSELKVYLKTLEFDLDNTDIVVRAYANFTGLTQACAKNGAMRNGASLNRFANGFTQRQALFDFVDVGTGKERADHKIREAISFFVGNGQCNRLILGCCHDSGYAPFLEKFAADDSIRERITLLKGSSFDTRIAALGFKNILKLDSVFALQKVDHVPFASSAMQVKSQPARHSNPSIDSSRLGPVLRDGNGKRIDRPLEVDLNAANVQNLKKSQLCHYFYLRGSCSGCNRDHTVQPLIQDDYYALWYLSRLNLCNQIRKGKNCDDPKCIYGHQRS